jgi:hypothetical protein
MKLLSHAQVADQLSAYVDGALGSDVRPEVAEHLGECAECRAEHAELVVLAQLVRSLPKPPLTPFGPFWARLEARLPRRRSWLPAPLVARRWALAPILAAALLAVGAVGGAYASEGAYPDSPLYGVKLLREDIQLGVTSDKKARTHLMVRFANTRLDEARTMTREGKDALAVQSLLRLQSLVQQIGTANQRGVDQSGPDSDLQSLNAGLDEVEDQTATPEVRETVEAVRQEVERAEPKKVEPKRGGPKESDDKDRERQEQPKGGERD